jgi:hypothetical protein
LPDTALPEGRGVNTPSDNSDETARAFCEAGRWLKVRDPKAANRFYKALILRCGKTALGQRDDPQGLGL